MKTKLILITRRAKLRSERSRIAYQLFLINRRIKATKINSIRRGLSSIQFKLRSRRAKIASEIRTINRKISGL